MRDKHIHGVAWFKAGLKTSSSTKHTLAHDTHTRAHLRYGWLSRQMEASPVPVDFLQPYVDMTKKRPKMLDGTHAGDYGFDPMSYANTDELLYFYMER